MNLHAIMAIRRLQFCRPNRVKNKLLMTLVSVDSSSNMTILGHQPITGLHFVD